MSYFFLALAILCTSLGQFFYKLFALNKKKSFLLVTLFLFGGVPVFSYMALKGLGIDIVYLSTTVSIVIILILSKCFLGEKIDRQKIMGSFLIIVGITCYAQ